MLLIGNDIVDLKTPEALGKAGDHRFVDRVLTRGEQAVIEDAQHPDALLWAFWAAKEAAYKSISKAFPGVSSAPRRYPVALDARQWPGIASGAVQTPCGTVWIRMFFGADYVHCIASAAGSSSLFDIVHGLEEIAPGSGPVWARESEAVRKAAGARIASLLDCSPDTVRIRRLPVSSGQGPPAVFLNAERLPIDISLSHDGRFAAYALRFAPGLACSLRKRKKSASPVFFL